jgi:hypothetical protein
VQGVLDGIPTVLVLLAGIGAPLAGWYASRRSRNAAVWFTLGALTGPIAVGILAVSPPGRCPSCEFEVEGWPAYCDHCGAPLRGGAEAGRGPATASDMTLPPPTALVAAPYVGRPTPVPSQAMAGTFTPIAPTPIDSARSSPRRDTRPWPGRPMASPMSLGVRPTFTASNYVAATSPDASSHGEVLSTGIYISGNANLEIGATYAIARDGDRLRVFGPVDAGQLTVRHEGSVVDFDVTAMDDRVIIAGRDGRSSVAIVFRTVGGMRAADLELALAANDS